jgi:UDP-GlcNAc:undecaprenyl-phosphate/decaprenyl-phosphate GlcNAc-1-phosphate transferase
MSYWAMLSCALVGLGIAFLAIRLGLASGPLRNRLQRGQDLHHTHQRPIPRLGGLALAIAFIGIEAFIAIFWPEQRSVAPGRSVVLLSSLAMFGLGFWDDLKPLGAKRKLLMQILIALSVYFFGIGIERFRIPFVSIELELHYWGVLVTVLWLVGMTNLINLIDGMDGLAGGICLMLMCLLIYVGHESGGFVLLVSGMAGALIGFLRFNFPPARIYLGDSGAYFLGFQIGLFAILNSNKGTVFAALVAPLFVLALPILDTTLAILRRGLRGLPIFRPDRRHLHHHLLEMGLSGRKALLSFYAVTSVFLAMGFAAYWSRGNLIPALLGIGALILLLCAGRLNFSRSWFSVGRVVGQSLEMRREVEYALALTRWLALEGGRRQSAEELWKDLTFAAQRLGYRSVRMDLADGQRVWGQPDSGPETRSLVQVLQGGRLGTLELQASACEVGAGPPLGTRPCERSSCPCVAEERVFAVVSELLAEGWITAASKMANHDRLPLRFATIRSRPNHPSAHTPCPSVVPARLSPVTRPAAESPAKTVT